ncbi:MAG: hypothetical protein AAB631_01610 [Patescibacteria group bacterium]
MKQVLFALMAVITVFIFNGCKDDRGTHFVEPTANVRIEVNRNIAGSVDDLLLIFAESATRKVSGAGDTLVVVCPCYFGEVYSTSRKEGSVLQVIGQDTLRMVMLPGADYDVTIRDIKK